RGFGSRRLPASLDGLDDQAHFDGLGRDFDANRFAVDDGPDALQIGPELAAGDAGGLDADAAQVFRLSAAGDGVARAGLLAGKMTNAWHSKQTSLARQSLASEGQYRG